MTYYEIFEGQNDNTRKLHLGSKLSYYVRCRKFKITRKFFFVFFVLDSIEGTTVIIQKAVLKFSKPIFVKKFQNGGIRHFLQKIDTF